MTLTDLAWVRAFSTADQALLSDAQIMAFLGEYSSEGAVTRRKLTLADCLEYLAKDDVYESYSRGGISVGRNQLYDRAQQLRAEVGVSVATGTLSHAQYADEDGESL